MSRLLRRAMLCGLLAHAVVFAQSKVMTWNVDGVERQAIVYAPTVKTPSGKAPLVFAFHGHGDTAQNFQAVRIQEDWVQAIVVYMQGLPSPRDGAPGWQVEEGQDGDRDLKWVDQALASLHKEFAVDDARVYAMGFSNGAMFTYLLWAERPKVFAAFAPVAARLRPSLHFAVPKPLFHTGGQDDRQIPFADQEAAIQAAREADGAMGNGVSCGVYCTFYGSRKGAPVMTLIHPAGHVYPLEVSQRIVDFFRQYSLRQ
jgi:polyhydroxybutyrate depolymerase